MAMIGMSISLSKHSCVEVNVRQLTNPVRYRLRRTLEVALTVQTEADKESMMEKLYTGERNGGLESFGYDVRCFFLCPDDRMGHTKIIDKRCEQMIMKGLLQETAGTLCVSL